MRVLGGRRGGWYLGLVTVAGEGGGLSGLLVGNSSVRGNTLYKNCGYSIMGLRRKVERLDKIQCVGDFWHYMLS